MKHRTCAILPLVAIVATAGAQQIDVQNPPAAISTVGGRPLGTLSLVALDPNGRTLVIGGPSRQELFFFDAAGKTVVPTAILSDLGAPIGLPAAAVFDGAESVVIVDAQGPRWTRLATVSGRWAVDTAASTDFSRVSGLCAMKGRRYLFAKRGKSADAGLLHEVDEAATIIRSFGKPFSETDNPATAYGHLLCLPRSGNVVVTSRLYPEIRSYASNGRLLWSTPVSSFRPVGFETNGRRITFAYAPDSLWDETVALFAPAPDVIAVQVARQRGRPTSHPYVEVRTLFLSAKTGATLRSQQGLPVILAASPTRLYTLNDKNPAELHVYSYTYHDP